MAEAQVSEAAVAELAGMLEEVVVSTKALTPQQIATALSAKFDKKTHKPKEGFTYIPQAVIRRRVNNATNNMYEWELVGPPIFRDGQEIQKANTLVMIVIGKLSIPGLGSRYGIGTAAIRKGSEEQYKSAESDAFKRAAMAFGVALELYPGELEENTIQSTTVVNNVVNAEPTPIATTRAPRAKAADKPADERVLGMPEIKAEIKRLSNELTAEWMSNSMRTKFNCEKSSEMTEAQWRELYAIGVVESGNRKAAQAA